MVTSVRVDSVSRGWVQGTQPVRAPGMSSSMRSGFPLLR
jgi:hypothetical protein